MNMALHHRLRQFDITYDKFDHVPRFDIFVSSPTPHQSALWYSITKQERLAYRATYCRYDPDRNNPLDENMPTFLSVLVLANNPLLCLTCARVPGFCCTLKPHWMKKVLGAIQNGDSVIVENCPQEIDASLNPVLQVQTRLPRSL